ncbi:MAG: alpha/beta hydrolase [Gammaproteobacteria bacterium]|nr:alpha/beta hydrolase [Gammaproteobacteria bacterium]MDH5777008.1 alpha/beta hydrolase [Gammaproteobacteria bacterium]
MLYKIGIFAVIFYFFINLYVYFIQASLIFFPDKSDRHVYSNPEKLGLKYQDVYLSTPDGERIHGWFIPNHKTPVTVLFSHGNAGNIADRLDSIKIFHELGLSIFIYDYRGYGKSTGEPSEKGTYLDNRTAWEYLVKDKKVSPKHIVVFGRSLGAAMASQLSTQLKPGAVILESAFTSIPDMAANLYPFLPIRWLSRFKYNNSKHVKNLSSPLLVIHSKDDEMIPFAHGEKLFEHAKVPKQFLTLSGGHNDGFMQSYADYSIGLQSFLREHISDYQPAP